MDDLTLTTIVDLNEQIAKNEALRGRLDRWQTPPVTVFGGNSRMTTALFEYNR